MRIHRHIVDLAGSGLVLLGFLLAAMAISATPVLIRTFVRHDGPQVHSAGDGGQTLSSPGGAT